MVVPETIGRAVLFTLHKVAANAPALSNLLAFSRIRSK